MGFELNVLGEYVSKVREKYKVPVREICGEMKMSSSTYSRLIKGKAMIINHYIRAFGYVVETYGENEGIMDKHYGDFFRIGNELWKDKMEEERKERGEERKNNGKHVKR